MLRPFSSHSRDPERTRGARMRSRHDGRPGRGLHSNFEREQTGEWANRQTGNAAHKQHARANNNKSLWGPPLPVNGCSFPFRPLGLLGQMNDSALAHTLNVERKKRARCRLSCHRFCDCASDLVVVNFKKRERETFPSRPFASLSPSFPPPPPPLHSKFSLPLCN